MYCSEHDISWDSRNPRFKDSIELQGYECPSCGEIYETDEFDCPDCEGEKLKEYYGKGVY